MFPKRPLLALATLSLIVTSASAQQPGGDIKKQVIKLMMAGRYEDAKVVLDNAIKQNPKESSYYNWRADTQIRQGGQFLKSAIADCREAIKIDPKSGAAYETRAMIYADVGDLDKALQDADKAVQLGDSDLRALDFRGNVHMLRGELTAALNDLNSVLKSNSGYIAAHSDRSFIYGLMGKYDKSLEDADAAISLMQKAKLFNASDRTAYGNRARAYIGLSNYAAALPDADLVVKAFPKNCRGYDLRAEIYKKFGKNDLASKDEQTARQLRRDPNRLWLEKQTYDEIKHRIRK